MDSIVNQALKQKYDIQFFKDLDYAILMGNLLKPKSKTPCPCCNPPRHSRMIPICSTCFGVFLDYRT